MQTNVQFEFLSISELSDKGAWVALNYVNRFSEFKEFDDNVERIHVKDVSCQEFIDRFEKLYKPVVIEGMQVTYLDSILVFSNVCSNVLYCVHRKVGRQTKNGRLNGWQKSIEIKSSNAAKTMRDTALK